MKQLTYVEALTEEIEELIDTVGRLEDEAGESNKRIAELEGASDDFDDARVAIEAFLARVERPVGKRTFTIKPGKMTDQAIVGLHDAIGKNL